MKKWVLPVLVIAAMVLVACPAPAAPSAPAEGDETAPSAEAPATGKTVVYNSYNSDPLPREADEELIAAFEAATGTDVEHSVVAHEDFKQAIRTYSGQSTRRPMSSPGLPATVHASSSTTI